MAIDATIAGASADSYLTVAEADAYANADLGPEATAWLPASTALKEASLKRATREIDGYLRSGWQRYASTVTTPYVQARLFPRAIDYTGTSPRAPFLVPNIKLATYEQATYVFRNSALLDNAATRRARGLSSSSEPNVSQSESTSDLPVLSPAALHYLEGYRTAGATRGLHAMRVSAPGAAW